MNFNGATFKDTGKAGIGMVIRNDYGQVLASLSEQIHLLFSSDMVETLAAAKATSFALEIGLSSFIFGGDAQSTRKHIENLRKLEEESES